MAKIINKYVNPPYAQTYRQRDAVKTDKQTDCFTLVYYTVYNKLKMNNTKS